MDYLDYTAVTASGEAYEIRFPLHPQTLSASTVEALLTAVLEAVSQRVEAASVSDGDVLQALAMASAIRMKTIDAPMRTSQDLFSDLLSNATLAADNAVSFKAGRA